MHHRTKFGLRSKEEARWIDAMLRKLRERAQSRSDYGSITYAVSRWLDKHQKVAKRALSDMEAVRLKRLKVGGLFLPHL